MDTRLRALRPAELTETQRQVYEHIAGGPRTAGPQLFELVDPQGRLNGPFNAMLVAPGVGDALQSLGAAVRYATQLTPRIREMAILAVATATDCAFERYAHEPIGRAAGLEQEEVEQLRTPGTWSPPDPAERLAHAVVEALLAGRDVDDATYDNARAELGEAVLVELAVLVGYYQTLALTMRLFRIGVPPAVES